MIPQLPSIINFQTNVLVWAVVIHVIIDWLFQTDWMAVNKTSLSHPAAWVHSGMHAAGLLLVFPWYLALGVGLSHLLIDTRHPVGWWIRNVKRMPKSTPTYTHVEIWLDQIFHASTLVAAVLIYPYLVA